MPFPPSDPALTLVALSAWPLLPAAGLLMSLAISLQSSGTSPPGGGPGDTAPQPTPGVDLSGFEQSLRGETIEYECAEPGHRRALLVRSTDPSRDIAWETAPAPARPAPAVAFTWMFGIDVHGDRHPFELRIDGRPVLAFEGPPAPAPGQLPSWRVAGREGVVLDFRATRCDRYGDLHGYARLTVPRGLLTPGAPLRLSIAGERAASRTWTMVFERPVRPRLDLNPLPAVVRGPSGPTQLVTAGLVHLGEETRALLRWSDRRQPVTLAFGWNQFELPFPALPSGAGDAPASGADEARRDVTVRCELAGRTLEASCSLTPVRPWVVHLIQHTHTDIGYTRPVADVLAAHLRTIDEALDLCDATDAFPDDARFRWTCETTWAVREYLRVRPRSQVERFLGRVREGRVEVAGLLYNTTEVMGESLYPGFLRPVRDLRARGIPVTTAVQNDVNGAAWCLADLLPGLGVDALVMGEHGHRARIPFDRPTLFWWQSRAGKRLLAWRPDHYNTGNFWGVQTGRLDTVAPPLFAYLRSLEERDYPHECIAVQYSGHFTDNSPPSRAGCEIIRQWNEKYVWPQLRSSTFRAFLAGISPRERAQLPVRALAWPDWWSDGTGSAPRETAAARRAQGRLAGARGLLAIATLQGLEVPAAVLAHFEAAEEALLLYCEHTYGAAESISAPDSAATAVQWGEKAASVWIGSREAALAEEAVLGILRPHLGRGPEPRIVVFNPLSRRRSGRVELTLPADLVAPGNTPVLLTEDGARFPGQACGGRPEGGRWSFSIDDVPALGYRSARLLGEAPVPASAPGSGGVEVGGAASGASRDLTVLENEHYRVRFDPERGAIASLIDLDLELELVDREAPWGFGALVHEALGDREQLERFCLESVVRTTLSDAELIDGDDGPLWSSRRVRGELAGCRAPRGAELEVRLLEERKGIELCVRLRRNHGTDPEGIYLALPFALRDAQIALDVPGAEVRPARDLIPWTSSDWQVFQSYVTVRGTRAECLLTSADVHLVQLGGLQLGRFGERPAIPCPHVYAWLQNNYWTTNFRAGEGGDLEWRLTLTSDAPGAPERAARAGWNDRVPLVATRLAPGDRPATLPVSALELRGAAVLLRGVELDDTARAPKGGNLRLHLREIAGRGGRLELAFPGSREPAELTRVNAVGEPLAPPARAVDVAPWEHFFVRLSR